MQKHVNLVDLVKSFPTNIYLQNLASIQKRTSHVKFAHLAEKSRKGSISNLSTKVVAAKAEPGAGLVSAKAEPGAHLVAELAPEDGSPRLEGRVEDLVRVLGDCKIKI